VIGNDDPSVRLVASKHHVTAGLATKDKSDALQGDADVPSGKVGRELGHVALRAECCLRCLDFDELLACFSGNRIAGLAAVLNVELNRFPNIV
jgi:hypothetical protein